MTVSLRTVVKNKLGVHARPAMQIVDLANRFQSEVRLAESGPYSDDRRVDGKSIMQVMMLALTQGTAVEIVCTGADEEEAAEAIRELLAGDFGESGWEGPL